MKAESLTGLQEMRKMLTNSNNYDTIIMSTRDADFLCSNSPLVCDREATVSLVDRRTRAFLLEVTL